MHQNNITIFWSVHTLMIDYKIIIIIGIIDKGEI